jgi:spore coat polysaccharide biosynthesis protein SpsF (cytidylyltransferase family)
VALIREGRHDVVTNLVGRSWPYGISAEVMTVEALRRAHGLSSDPKEREHVTRLFYARPERFSILNLRSDLDPESSSGLRFTVDTEQDLQRCERLAAALGARVPIAGTHELIATSPRVERSTPQMR